MSTGILVICLGSGFKVFICQCTKVTDMTDMAGNEMLGLQVLPKVQRI